MRTVVFGGGETLVDKSREWLEQARAAGIPAFAFHALLGSLIERSKDHRLIWEELAVPPPEYRKQILFADLYPDAIACLRSLQHSGLALGIAGNQPSGAAEQLSAAGVSADFIASSAQRGVAKPSGKFFARIIAESGFAAPSILYVGDRLDNDVLPARRAGMKTALVVRGPWGHIHARRAESVLADYRIHSLNELVHLWD
ncbi:HAD family hydrolase [Glutamicibacter sp.]|uniref:HAD family hydrolase n=1 Tax=Glutamicibacter sp. TaxID=1931995 RepID=UPI003D6B3317